MSPQPEQYFLTHSSSFTSTFDPYSITSAERIPHSKQTFYVETPTTDAYLIDLSVDPANKTSDDAANIIQIYKAALKLGVSTPEPVLGRDWVATKPFQGKQFKELPAEERRRAKETIDEIEVVWDCVKLFLLGYSDNTPQNFLVNENGEFRHIDLQSANRPFLPNVNQFVYGTTAKFNRIGFPVSTYRSKFEPRVISLAQYVQDHNDIFELIPDPARRNVEWALEVFPLVTAENSHSPSDRPVVDESIIPPSPEKPVEIDIQLKDLPSCVSELRY